jgi:hypothetical protein
MVMKSSRFWDIMPCIALKVTCLFCAAFLLDLLLTPEDGGDMFLQNVG